MWKSYEKIYGTGRYCSIKCSNTRKHTEESKLKISKAVKRYADLHSSYILTNCKCCNKLFKVAKTSKNKYCSLDCETKYKEYLQLKNEFKILQLGIEQNYKAQCSFKFYCGKYPDYFDLELIDKYGLYDSLKNKNGITRDHKISVHYGLIHGIDPYIISHPANCELMRENDNRIKNRGCSLDLNTLIKNIDDWNIKYGVYPNKIDYLGLTEFITTYYG